MGEFACYFWTMFFLGFAVPVNAQKETKDKHFIYVSSISWHTGIVIPTYSLPDSIWREGDGFSDVPYLGIGLGEADFYPHPKFNLCY